MAFLYHMAIAVYTVLIRMASPFSAKAKAWVKGRRGWKKELENAFAAGDKVLWFHAASLGEFEQGRPVMEAVRREYPSYKILLTFFSPSGYLQKKNYPGADKVMYLPPDSRRNADCFVSMLRPQLAVFIKYEFWFNYLVALERNNVPLVFISALFREKQHFFQWYGGWFRKRLRKAEHIYLQDTASEELLHRWGIMNTTVSGDTRFDRVADILKIKYEDPAIENFCHGSRVLIAGSTWPPDEELLATIPGNFPGLKVIIAPHEVREDRIEQLRSVMDMPVLCYTKDNPAGWHEKQVLLIDTIGLLSSIYRYADIAYIGGAFSGGLHNIQEPAVNGIPVIFGPGYQKFREAVDLAGRGGAFPVKNAAELRQVLNRMLADEKTYRHACQTNRNYMLESTGATQKIMEGLGPLLKPGL
jgi:3-deoxy-D-manno-octulosonic-acid transferase